MEKTLVRVPNRSGIRDWGVTVGSLPTGPLNKITDVPGVLVGHATVDDPAHKTGVTVVIPAPGCVFAEKLTAGAHVINGFGKTCGTVQLNELGTLETPIALTSTLNVGKVADALVAWTVSTCAALGIGAGSVNPVVGETNDGRLNRAADRPVGEEHLRAAIDGACADFDEGDVGAGKGTSCFGLKGGIGSSSRVVELGGKSYTVGVLVQSNFGRLDDLMIDGRAVGREIRRILEAPAAECDKGSCMIVVATDLPLSELQLGRVLRRAEVGLVRTGSYVGHGSGDVVLGFTTANRRTRSDGDVRTVSVLNDNCIEAAFRAVAEATEEAVLNSMCAANEVCVEKNGKTVRVRALSEFLPQIMKS